MQFHEIIVWLLFILTIFFVLFGMKIKEEIRLLLRTEEKESYQEGIHSFFEPLTWSERNLLVQNHSKLFKDLQSRLSKSWIAKYFIDYKDKIDTLNSQLKERSLAKDGLDPEPLSYSTLNLVQIFASQAFEKENLLDFGYLLDHHFSDSEIEFLSVDVGRVDGKNVVQMDLSCQQLEDNQQLSFQNFFHEACATVFEGEQLDLQVNCKEKEKSYHFSVERESL